MKKLFRALIAGISIAVCCAAGAQPYPSHPITLVIPSAPGGILDVLARMIGDAMQAEWGQPAVVLHKPGAAGIIGSEFVAKAKPDGYTLLMGNVGPLGINPALYPALPYDAVADFAPVAQLATFPNVLVVGSKVPAGSVAEVIALAKQKPGALTYASPGIGQTQHLSGEVFMRMTGMDIVHVPYKGTGPALVDVVGGQVTMMFSNLSPALPLVKAGKLKALAVTGRQRSAALPDVPTMSEAGVAGYEVMSWVGLVAPAGTSPEIIQRLHALVAKTMKTPAAIEKYEGMGAAPGTGSSTDLGAFIKSEIAKWTKVVREGGIKPE